MINDLESKSVSSDSIPSLGLSLTLTQALFFIRPWNEETRVTNHQILVGGGNLFNTANLLILLFFCSNEITYVKSLSMCELEKGIGGGGGFDV